MGLSSPLHATPAGLLLAAIVTVHVLLRKREQASAAGWIGLAWFAPFIGAVAYALLGVNRVQRRAQRLRPDPRRLDGEPPDLSRRVTDHHLDPLAQGIGRLTGRQVLGGNAVETYQNGDEAYPRMLDAIASAQHSVGLSSYILFDDHWGGRFVGALAAAERRGVAVRVLVDGVGSGWIRSPAYHHLRRRGVTAARFLHSPLPWRMPFLNLRSHKKILVVDGTVGFTGGMNISDFNVMAAHTRAPVQDTHFRVAGPAVRQLAGAFAEDWSFAAGEDLSGPAWFPDIEAAGQAPARVITSGPDEDIEKLEFAMLQAVACARETIVVMTPYFLPDDRMITALSLAALRGVAVEVVVPERSDHRLVDWASWANAGPLLADGVRIWRCPPPFRHSKVMAVDGLWCLVGSCNWDIRSFRLNFELCVEFYDAALTRSLAAFVQTCRGRPFTQADLDTRPLPVRLRDAAARLCMPYL